MRWRRQLDEILSNPNLGMQVMVVILVLASESIPIDRRIEKISLTIDRFRSVTDVINNTMQSMKNAAEAPKQIRRIFE